MSNRPKVLMVASYEGLAPLAKKVAAEKNVEIEVVNKSMVEALKTAVEYEHSGIDCIISRGPTGVYLRNNLSTPVILIQVTAFDIMQALSRASQLSHKLAYIDHVHRMNSYDLKAMIELIGIGTIKSYYYCDLEMLTEQLEIACQEGIDTVVAPDNDVMVMAEEKGLRGVFIDSKYEAVAEAMARAKEIANLREKDREANLFMRKIIDNYEHGLVVLDDKQRISHLNRSAERMLRLQNNNSCTGRSISTLEGLESELVRAVEENNQLVNKVFRVHQSKVLINTIPLSHNKNFRGIIMTMHPVAKIQQMEARIRQELYAKGLVARHSFDEILGQSPSIKKTISFAQSFAEAEATVLLSGESGTGKELFAHSIHQTGARRNGPFVSVNCAAIPDTLLESELFGYSEGAFTGARRGGKPGLFEIAHGGTLLLDEVSEIPLHLQAQLLRVLQEKAVRRIGDDELTMVEVRVIASTNRNLLSMTREGKFRQDLYYRLNVLNLDIPPLRDRPEDIMLLASFFYKKFSGRDLPALSEETTRLMASYNWPGNVRELENLIERLVVLTKNTDSRQLSNTLDSLIHDNLGSEDERQLYDVQDQDKHIVVKVDTLSNMEQQIINKLKKQNNQSREQLADKLGISRTTLWNKLRSSN